MKDNAKYEQLCVIQGVTIEGGTPKEFEEYVLKELGFDIKFEAEVVTLPGQGGEGGRHDVFFYINSDEIERFAVPRLQYHIRWWEDIFFNNSEDIYPLAFREAHPKTW